MENSKFDLIVIGHLLKEKIIFADGKEIGPVLGSPAAYSSVATACLGLKVGLVTKIGKDMPKDLLDVFSATQVDIGGMKKEEKGTENLLLYDQNGNKRLDFLSKAPEMVFEDIPSDYLSAQTFLICPIDYEVPLELLKKLSLLKKDIVVDLGGYGGASSKAGRFTLKEKASFLRKIVPIFKIVKAGREDCRHLFGEGSLTEEKILAQFIHWGAEVSIVTLGSEGVLVTNQREGFKIPAFPCQAIDCTGAGDVWYGGFLAEYISEIKNGKFEMRDLGDVVKKASFFASGTASLVIEKAGGVTLGRMPKREEVEERMKKYSGLIKISLPPPSLI